MSSPPNADSPVVNAVLAGCHGSIFAIALSSLIDDTGRQPGTASGRAGERSVEARLRIRPRSGGLEGRGGGEHGPVAMAPADDLKPHGQSRRGETDRDRRRRLSGEVERIRERDPVERADLASRDLLDAG